MKDRRIFWALILLLMTVSCHHDPAPSGWSNGIPDIEMLFIGGKVMDSKTGEPIEGATIVLCAYEKSDLTRFFPPYYRDTTYTAADGSYRFLYEKCMETRIYSIKARDRSALRQEHYQPLDVDLYLEQSSPCYNTMSKSYILKDSDLYLSK